MASLVNIVVCVATYFIGVTVAADLFVADAPAAEPSPAEAFLYDHNVRDPGEIFYYKRTENVTDCLQSSDAKSRLLQICQARDFFEHCAGGADLYDFSDCKGNRCIATFSKERSQCLLEESGAELTLREQLGSVCAARWSEHPLASWQPVPWTLAIGGTNDFHCLTAMPTNTSLERKFMCEGNDPILQFRMRFDSGEFLRTNERDVRCVAIQHCGLPTIFAGEVACYELPESNLDDDVPELSIQADESVNDISSTSSLYSSSGFICVLFFFSLLAVMFPMVATGEV